ncbi:Dehydrogenase OXI1 [Colletotrichum fructicola]|nr:Dehydrogenase OXI1 [Colletotrichum fructicola]
MPLKGKVAIVTGAARGIGAGIVRALAKEGASVAFNYVSPSSESAAVTLVEEVKSLGSRAVCVRVDMASLDAPKDLLDATLEEFQTDKIDILINNAGLGGNAPLEEVTVEDYDRLMTVNVRAVIFMTQAVLPHINRGGRIVNLSSISSRGGYSTQSVYAASKAAVEGLTRVWATELGHKYGVTVNCVNPGPVDTDMYRAAGPVHLARMEEQNKKVPAEPRCGTEQDIADIVVFLCEERSRWITGDTVCANGGMLYFRYIRDDRSHSPPDLEFDTIEALEWDETIEQNILTDGIGSLSLQTKASGYMGPQSGNALLRHLHSVVHFLSEGEADLDFSSFPVDPETSQETQALIHSNGFRNECLDWYFQHFHKAYPLLHEGFFRAQFMGAIPKPKDGSWAVLFFEPIAGRAALILSRIMDLVPCSPNSVADLAANDAVRMGITDIWSESWLQVDYQAMSDLVQTVDSNDVEL